MQMEGPKVGMWCLLEESWKESHCAQSTVGKLGEETGKVLKLHNLQSPAPRKSNSIAVLP